MITLPYHCSYFCKSTNHFGGYCNIFHTEGAPKVSRDCPLSDVCNTRATDDCNILQYLQTRTKTPLYFRETWHHRRYFNPPALSIVYYNIFLKMFVFRFKTQSGDDGALDESVAIIIFGGGRHSLQIALRLYYLYIYGYDSWLLYLKCV